MLNYFFNRSSYIVTKIMPNFKTAFKIPTTASKGSKLNRVLRLRWTFLEVMLSTFAQRGARRDKKERTQLCELSFPHLSVH